ncbi:MAG: phosphoglucosamine mutase [Saprospiraceae bacterium]|nr:phosphoglucosamine mutase [Saprospiraceae bacterium]
MPLIKSISGIRGTIGGTPGENLTPVDVVEAAAAFAARVKENSANPRVVIGRDGRISGPLVGQLVSATLRSMGITVIDLGLSTTPTVEMAVTQLRADGGVIITASHNPQEWNALKLLNAKGEFISAAEGQDLLNRIAGRQLEFAPVDQLGGLESYEGAIAQHIAAILQLPLVDVPAIRARHYRIVVDPVNSTGALAVPPLLDALGCETVLINGEVNGRFAHNPEPLAEHLTGLSQAVVQAKAHLGIAVDPDVDRLVFMDETGTLFGEEYTLVAVADYVLSQNPGNTVSNLSSSRALRDVTLRHGGQYFAAAVGEVNVVEKMKSVGAVIGGEGNGGVILPDLHYGRDALAGIALFLTHLAHRGTTVSALRSTYPEYHMIKAKMALAPGAELSELFAAVEQQFAGEQFNREDGLKIDFPSGWVHLRASNTEPILRVYAEAASVEAAGEMAEKVMHAAREAFR